MILTVDLDDETDALHTAVQAIWAEINRRELIESAADQVEAIARSVLEAEGVKPGDEWRQPLGGHDSYPLGWTVTHDGKTWESLIAGNAFEPGVSGWREVVEEGDYPDFVQPTGAHDAYNMGEIVRFEGELFKSNMNGNVWSPADYPAGWTLIE